MQFNDYKTLEAAAATLARQNHITKEKAVAELLSENPEVYEKFRAAHNLGPLVRQLEEAGLIRKK
ncbi:MAG: hypothetical protein WCB12_01285 [Bryobacteraceae bacterium]